MRLDQIKLYMKTRLFSERAHPTAENIKYTLVTNNDRVTWLFCCVQNEEDDWQENEELRAIEGLEGERNLPLHHQTLSTQSVSSSLLYIFLNCRSRSIKTGIFWTKGEDCPDSRRKLLFHSGKEKLVKLEIKQTRRNNLPSPPLVTSINPPSSPVPLPVYELPATTSSIIPTSPTSSSSSSSSAASRWLLRIPSNRTPSGTS